MVLAVKVYFKVDESLKPEEVQEVVRLLQERTTELLRNRYSMSTGPKIQAKGFRFRAEILDWNTVQKELKVQIVPDTPKSEAQQGAVTSSKKKS